MPENKTKPTAVPVEEFLMTVGEQRASEARVLIGMMQAISGEPPIMWGPSIIGFGQQHYKTDAGREGDIGLLGFSPRKTALTIYFYEGFDRYGEELARLGKHKASKSCLYINTLSDIDLNVLQAMLQASYDVAAKSKTHVRTGSNGTAAISGNDTSGTVSVNTGVGAGNGLLATVTFTTKYADTPHVVVTPVGRSVPGMYINRTSAGFTISVDGAMPPGGYAFDYIVVQ